MAEVRDSPDDASEVEQSELEQATQWLERVTRDPMADAVAGTVQVVAASPPAGRGRYQECHLDLRAEARGIPSTLVTASLVFPRKTWPAAGDVVPARISRSHPETFEADWERLSRR